MSRDKNISIPLVGYSLIALGVLANEWIIAVLFSPDGVIASDQIKWLIRLFAFLLLLSGILCLRYQVILSQNKFSVSLFNGLALFEINAFVLLFLSFGLFLIIEFFPNLIHPLHLTNIRYYAQMDRYLPDDELIFVRHPFYKFESREFKGDLYSPIYGVDVPAMLYKKEFDENGLRNPTPTPFSDIIILGDSFMEVGLNAADVFSEHLERASGLTAMNLGIGWYGPYQYLLSLHRFGLKQNSRYAIMGFFEGNDMKDIQEYQKWQGGGDYYSFLSRNILRRYLMVLHDIPAFFKEQWRTRYWQRKVQAGNKLIPPELIEVRFQDKTVKMVFGYKNELRPPFELLETPEWQALKSILTKFKATCQKQNILPVVLFIPSKVHILGIYTTQNSGSKWVDYRAAQIAAQENNETTLTQLCQALGIKLVSLTDPFSTLAKQGILAYFPFDTHWNPLGREVAAEFLTQELHLNIR